MKKWLNYILIFMFIFIGMDGVEATGNSCNSTNINTDNWHFVSTETGFNESFLDKETKTNSTLVTCCQLGGGQTLRYACDTYTYVGDPEDNIIEGTGENEDTNITCPSDYDLSGFTFSYNQSSNSDKTNKTSNSITCCRQSSHVGGSSQYSCNVYTSDEYLEDQEDMFDDDEEDLGAISGCEDLGETGELIRQIYNLLKYLIPILIVGLSIVDFLKVILNGEEKVFNEAWTKFIKRIIVGIVILILPMILSFVIGISGVLENYDIDATNIFCIFR